MQARVKDVIEAIERIAPASAAQDWDSVGLKTGSPENSVTGVLLCVDVTKQVLRQAVEGGFEMIFAHHPLMFSPVSTLREDEPEGALLCALVREKISVFCAHTNFDACPIGTSRSLALAAGFENPVCEGFLCAAGTQEMSVSDLARRVKAAVGSGYVCTYGERAVKNIVFCAGSANGEMARVRALRADALVCGELKYHEMLEYLALGIPVVTCGHRESEAPALWQLLRYLQNDENLVQCNLRYRIASQDYDCVPM